MIPEQRSLEELLSTTTTCVRRSTIGEIAVYRPYPKDPYSAHTADIIPQLDDDNAYTGIYVFTADREAQGQRYARAFMHLIPTDASLQVKIPPERDESEKDIVEALGIIAEGLAMLAQWIELSEAGQDVLTPLAKGRIEDHVAGSIARRNVEQVKGTSVAQVLFDGIDPVKDLTYLTRAFSHPIELTHS